MSREYVTTVDVRILEDDLSLAIHEQDEIFTERDIQERMLLLAEIHAGISPLGYHRFFREFRHQRRAIRERLALVIVDLQERMNEVINPDRFKIIQIVHAPFEPTLIVKYRTLYNTTNQDFFEWLSNREESYPMHSDVKKLVDEYDRYQRHLDQLSDTASGGSSLHTLVVR